MSSTITAEHQRLGARGRANERLETLGTVSVGTSMGDGEGLAAFGSLVRAAGGA